MNNDINSFPNARHSSASAVGLAIQSERSRSEKKQPSHRLICRAFFVHTHLREPNAQIEWRFRIFDN